MNAMNEFVKPTLVLAIICLVITALLSVSHEITQQTPSNRSKGNSQKVYRKYIRLQMALAILLLLHLKVTPAIR